MYVVLGATGHVGSEAAYALLNQGEAVTVVTRDASKGDSWKKRGAEAAVVDVHDIDMLRDVLRRGKRAFLLNPPADPASDTDVEERKTVNCILAALKDSGLEKVVAESTYGAQPGDRCGDLNVLFELEQRLRSQSIPAAIIRAGYYLSNWDVLLEPAKQTGQLSTMLPADLKIPMVAPRDLGLHAARLLTEPASLTGITYVEGPERYSPADVAAAFSKALGRTVRTAVTPRQDWEETFRKLGFSKAAASSYARMTAVTVDGDFEIPSDPARGKVTLEAYVAGLVGRRNGQDGVL